MEIIKLNAGEANFAGKDVEAGVELVKAAVGHLDTYGFTDVMIFTVENHNFVLLRTAEELFLRAFADTFNQNIIFLAHTTAVGYSRLFSLQVD